MKYTGMPTGMWLLFSGSFRKQLEEVLGYSREEACKITVNAKRQYRKLIGKLPEFERKDRFKMNIVNCAMLSAFLLNMPERPSVLQATEYYKKSMMTKPMKWFCHERSSRILLINICTAGGNTWYFFQMIVPAARNCGNRGLKVRGLSPVVLISLSKQSA